jgi:hypothetical protein
MCAFTFNSPETFFAHRKMNDTQACWSAAFRFPNEAASKKHSPHFDCLDEPSK